MVPFTVVLGRCLFWILVACLVMAVVTGFRTRDWKEPAKWVGLGLLMAFGSRFVEAILNTITEWFIGIIADWNQTPPTPLPNWGSMTFLAVVLIAFLLWNAKKAGPTWKIFAYGVPGVFCAIWFLLGQIPVLAAYATAMIKP